MIQFQEKFTGAKARLFAAVCMHYIHAAEDDCNDAPSQIPLFSWLSPYQRVHLVKELMIGLLCKDEPLPPGTLQHYATFRGLVETLKTELSIELDMQGDCYGEGDIGDDLIVDDEDEHRYRSKEEIEERNKNFELIRHRAEKNKKKLDKKGDNITGVPEKEHRPMEEQWKDVRDVITTLFDGPPLTQAERERVRKPNDDEEQCAFNWRLRCDEAFQEDRTGHVMLPPLSAVSFDFRSQNRKKWMTAVDLLFITFSKVECDQNENWLVCTAIDERAYADKSQHARIQTVKKNISILRKTYENTWDANFLGEDQRCIYAVCSNEHYAGYGHKKFVSDFIAELQRRGVSFTEPGHYQERYDLYKELAPSYTEGLKHPFHAYSEKATSFQKCDTPREYVAEDDEIHVRCAKDGCYSYTPEKLRQCSKCKVVLYCSRDCQVSDWPNHRKFCKQMAKLRSDKAAVQKLAKGI